ncbi:hypothetical protein EAH68_13395 [Corynebacterium hylobatis]|uniref:Uncharacterized protein n=1 Tax=Corynebacterium hylobatis TaxID=1859290 RepID=A0A3S0B2W2_9CORY|nr:hypothetical protein [Corynebacterium hylobatis]RSZ61377.1 hypothetical protein EAH68_13395 [Corynebacterium hylobatis]
MTFGDKALVPVWVLATDLVKLPDVLSSGEMNSSRLAELRTVLATLADSPITTLEAHPVSAKRDRTSGIVLHAASPLAQQLSQLISQTTKTAPQNLNVGASGEMLYRMVVPAKVAEQVSKGLVTSMKSKAVAGGFHGTLRDSTGIVAQATFVPVAGKATVLGAATGSAATAGVATATAGALTVAAPLGSVTKVV